MCAGKAAERGADATILERMSRPARKLMITGKGRCNLTNVAPLADFLDHFGPNGRFLRQAFNSFFVSDLLDFFKREGVRTVTERGGRVFPVSNEAKEIVDALAGWAERNGAVIRSRCRVRRIRKLSTGEFRVEFEYSGEAKGMPQSKKMSYSADKVVIATGGASYPATGSTGDGYSLARSLGHTIIPIRPALVPLETSGDAAQELQGLSLRNVSVRLFVDGKKLSGMFGEMLFTHFGVSGPVILSLSKFAVEALDAGKTTSISIDLKPALDDKKLDARLMRDIDAHGRMKFRGLLKLLLPMKLIPVCADLVGISLEKPLHQLTAGNRKSLRNWLKDFRLEVTGHRSFNEAIITAGGVRTSEINPRTMESRIVRGLFMAGEVMDLDADTGGFNLQAAFSTGWLAGVSAGSE